MAHVSSGRALYILLIRLPFLQIRGRFLHPTLDGVLKNLILSGFALGVGCAEYAFFYRFWQVLLRIPMGFATVFPHTLSVIGSFLFTFLLYSSILTALSAIYRSDDLKLLLTFPVPTRLLLIYKWFEVFVRSGSTLLLLTIPLIVSLGVVFQMGFEFYFVFTIAVLALSALAVSIGTFAGMALMTLFPEKRLHQTIAIVGLCLAALLIAGLRFLHLETLWSEDPLSSPLIAFLSQNQLGFPLVSPGAVLSGAITPFLSGQTGGWSSASGGIIAASAGFAFTVFIGEWIFSRGWRRSQEAADAGVRRTGLEMSGRRLRVPGSPSFQSLMWKDWIVLRRDAAVWTQLFMMIPLAIIYIINLAFLPLEEAFLIEFFAVANVGLIGLIIAAIGARYLFPAASREGKSIWITACAPLSPSLMIVEKILFSSPPVIALSVVLFLISSWILGVESGLFLWCFVYGILSTVLLCVLAVSLGFCFPSYDHRHLLEVSLGKGAVSLYGGRGSGVRQFGLHWIT